MTDEGMRLLQAAVDALEPGMPLGPKNMVTLEGRAAWLCGTRSLRNEIYAYLSRREPQGEMPEPDVIQQAREAGDMAGTAVIKMLRAYDALASRLREADGQVAFWKERSMSADAEMNLYKGRAEAAERGEGMVMVSRSQIEEVIGMAQRFKDIGRRSPHKARMSILEAKLTGWLSAAEEKK